MAVSAQLSLYQSGLLELCPEYLFLKLPKPSRRERNEISSNSKLRSIRTFKGFLVNCFEPVECVLNSRVITIGPQEGTFIYMNEYKKHLQDKSSFFLPANIEKLLSTRGNRDNYTNQTVQFDVQLVDEENVLILLRMIGKYRKGLEQELLIRQI